MTAKEKVLAVYPDAFLTEGDTFVWAILSEEGEFAQRLGESNTQEGAWIASAHRLPTPVEPKAQVESASVEAISDHEKGQKEEFYKFQQHLEKTQEEISKWPSWMREAGRASMGLDQREPKEVESGGLPPLDAMRAGESVVSHLIRNRATQLKASLLREKSVVELLREAGSYIAGVGRETYGDILLERIKAAVTGE